MATTVSVGTKVEADRFSAIKARQQATWASGDFAVIGTTLQIVGELLSEAADVRAVHRVLDVAAGNGNATLAAARRFASVTSTDYVPALLERGRERADAEKLANVTFQVADAEALPYPDASFDVVLSTFGVMFAPNQERSASELLRVVRSGGRIGLANWTPTGFIGQMFKVVGGYVPPLAGVRSPLEWGTEARLVELFPDATVETTTKQFVFRYRSAHDWVNTFRTYYGPTHKAFAALDDARRASFERDLIALADAHNTSTNGTFRVPSDYLEIIIRKD